MKAEILPNQSQLTAPNTGLFNGKKIFSQVVKYWYLYILSLLICLSYAWFKVHYATPMYKVYGQVLVQDDKSGGSSSAQALNGNGMNFSSLFGSGVNIQNEITILQTRDLIRKVVDAMQLYISYFHEGKIRNVELYDGSPFQVMYIPDNNSIYPVTMQLAFKNQTGNGFDITVGNKTMPWHFYDTLHYQNAAFIFIKKGEKFDVAAKYTVSVQSPDAVADNIVGNLTAAVLGTKSTIFSLSYNTNNPHKGEKVLGGIMQAYVNRNLNNKNTISDSTIQFINQRIALVGNDLNSIENTIQTFKEKNKITDLTAQSSLLMNNSNTYFQKLNDLGVQLQVIATMLTYIENENNNQRPVPALLSSDPTFTGLITSYNEAQVQRDKMLLTLKNDNPIIENLNTQIAGLRSSMIKSLQSQQKVLTISKNDLAAQNSTVNTQIQKIPAQERQFLDYSREQDLRQALFLFLLQKREEIAIAMASNASNASIISAPKANMIPYEPVSNTAFTVAGLMGLLFPTSFIILKIMLNNKIMSRDDVSDASPVTILAEVGHNTKGGLINLSEEGRSMVAEQFRIFRTNMDFALSGAKSPVIMITSTMSGEGKSFIAANLGQIYAISGKKVLLMELDLRKPKLSQSLNVINETGFSNYILSDLPIQAFVKPVNSISNNLFILSAGTIPPNPSELLLSAKTALMIEEVKQLYDIIIIDTAPIGAVTDAQIISAYATASLYILRQGYTTKNSFAIINDLVLNNKISSLYLIINDIASGASYNYGYGYQYGYGYSDYYDTKKKKQRWWPFSKEAS